MAIEPGHVAAGGNENCERPKHAITTLLAGRMFIREE
jgi:hypothetical protein